MKKIFLSVGILFALVLTSIPNISALNANIDVDGYTALVSNSNNYKIWKAENGSITSITSPPFTGHGYSDDPYIMENWFVEDIPGKSEIDLRNINSKCFVIRNCYINSAINDPYSIKFSNVYSNIYNQGIIEGCILKNGIYFSESSYNIIKDCEISTIGNGIRYFSSNNNEIDNCVLTFQRGYYTANGIHIDSSNNNIIHDCDISDFSGGGIVLYGSYGDIYASYSNTFYSNLISNCDTGIELGNNVYANTFYGNYFFFNYKNYYLSAVGPNTWVNGDNSSGNYWDNYNEKIGFYILINRDSISPNIDYKPIYPLSANLPPKKPNTPFYNPVTKKISTGSKDLNGDQIQYRFDFGDGTISEWQSDRNASHSWSKGTYTVRAQARDSNLVESPWSDPSTVTIIKSKSKAISNPALAYILKILAELFPRLQYLI